jgi:prepilin-type N-terminal cleavage/methylation domain-containing protein
MNRPHAQSGFTLIELLLYVMIVGSLLTGAVGLYAMTIDARIKTQSINEVNQQGAYIMDYITQTIRNASSVAAPAATNTGTSLSLTVPTSALSPTTFSLNADTLQVREGAGSAVPLSNSNVQLSALSIVNLSRSSTNEIVQISFTVSRVNTSGLNRYDYQKTFTSSAEVSW